MATHKPNSPFSWDDADGPGTINVTELAIGGKMIHVRIQLSDSESMLFSSETHFREEMKKQLVENIAKYLLANNLVECTTMKSVDTYSTLVAARVCVVPDEQIRLLRVNGVVK